MQNHQYFCKFQLIPGLNSFARILVILKAQSNRKLAYKFSTLHVAMEGCVINNSPKPPSSPNVYFDPASIPKFPQPKNLSLHNHTSKYLKKSFNILFDPV